MTYEAQFQAYLEKANAAVFDLLPKTDRAYSYICKAMQYSLESGGKRIRPVLTLAFCELCGGDPEQALPFAAAVEYIHTYSLIHDDLPCMDDDDLRRGRAASHIRFGEANALLAGDALLTHAFSAICEAAPLGVPANQIVRAAHALSLRAGVLGMVGGQYLDLEAEQKKATESELQEIDLLKTCALIQAACELGCLAANAGEEEIAAAIAYAEALGMAFQITDDILDAPATTETLGKPVGSDAENEKSTYYSTLGLQGARERAAQYTQKALQALDLFEGDTAFLSQLTNSLLNRNA
ncbi:MAG: polyprenyl synthetase family protein [Oscillospiraceae bacterium]|jgi:geranylgeranyl diphosphate synthase type II|nr:polyprenyl synthetase family protein [Oscillospiraceae bacterium]